MSIAGPQFQKLVGRDRDGRYWLQEPGQPDLEINESIAFGMLERGEAGDDGTVRRAVTAPSAAVYAPRIISEDFGGDQPVSMLSSGLARLGISRNVQRGLVNTLVPAPIRAAGEALAPMFAGGGRGGGGGSPVSPYGFNTAGFPGGAGGGVISGAVSGLIQKYAPGGGGGGAAGNGCGCRASGRDPCTHQRTTNQRAPLASFLGGCCPPGRTLRRKPGARDVCIRTPRMNPFNPRALARADRRVTTFARRAAPIMKDLGFQVSRTRHPKIKVGRGRKRSRGR